MKKRFISLFLVAALCLGMLPTTALADAVVVVPPEGGDGDISVDVTPDNPGNVTVIVPGEDGGDVVVVIPPEEEEAPVIGDVVNFAGHEWYIIGTDDAADGGVTAPEGCYTLFAKNNDFGSTAYRTEENSGDRNNSTAFCYKDSDLYNRLNEIANGFSEAEEANIVPRKTLDDIMLKMTNDVVADQLLWPIGANEANTIDQSLRQFDAVYWGRSGDRGSEATDVFVTPKPSPGVATPTPTPTPTPTVTPTPEPYSTPKPRNNVFSVYAYNEDGSERVEATAGVLAGWNAEATNVFAVRPALYVKAEAVGAPKVTVPLTGGETYFGNQNWYIVGMGDTGPVPGPANTVTLFADSIVKGQYATTDINYSQGALCTAMNTLGASLDLSAQAQSLISSRTLTTEDEITGDSVTTPFWPLSKSEFEAIQAENQSLLTGDSWSYWLRTEAPSDWEIHRTVYAGDANGTLTQNSTPDSNFGVRPAFYLDLSNLFFAAGESSMGNSVNGNPVKLMPPSANSSQSRWNFVMYDSENLSLSMSVVQGQSGQSLTFQYNGTGGQYHFLAYVLEQDGVPVYYGNAASLKDSGSGTVTVPLLGSSSKLEDGDYTMRFYEEDRTDGIYFASNTVDLEIRVANGAVSVTDMGGIEVHTHNYGTELKYDETNHWRECACGEKNAVEAHTYDGDQDATCNVCGYERELSHTHDFGTDWESDAFNHWHKCSTCGEKTVAEAHSYDGDQDAECNICGYERELSRTHDFGWNSDAFAHWQECSCGEKTTAQAHTYDDDQDAECNICGYEREISHTHDFGTDWESDAFNHWHKCSTCGEKTTVEAHTYGESDTCTICGYVRPAAPEYTVTFNANGGSVSPSSAVTTDGKLTALPTPIRSGYDFVGWYTTASGGDRVTVNTVFTKNTTICAYWEKQSIGGGDDPIILPSKTPSEEVREDIENAQEGDTVEVTLKPGKTELGGEVFEELAGKNITLEITVPGGVMWMVNGQDIPTDTDLTDIDMGVSMNTSTIPVDLINMVTGEMGAVQMTLAHDGEFGFTMTLTAPVGVEDKGLWANLYHYDTTLKQMLFETAAQVDASGNVALKFTHASEYAIVLDTESHELPFTDVGESDWFMTAVQYVYRNGIMTGTGATTFEPNTNLSRAMVAQILYNLEGQPTVTGESTFTDVSGHWAIDAITWAQKTGVVTGYENNTFRPNQAVTREELAQMLYNYAQYKQIILPALGDLSKFPDGDEVSDWAQTAMSWANGLGAINGYEDNTLRPGGNTTRAEAASMIMGLATKLVSIPA